MTVRSGLMNTGHDMAAATAWALRQIELMVPLLRRLRDSRAISILDALQPSSRAALLACVALAGIAMHADGQAVRRVPSSPSCALCRVEVRDSVLLGRAGDRDLVQEHAIIKADGRGRLYHAAIADPGRILVFSERGEFLRSIGRFGSGPGEFRSAIHFAFRNGDTLLVLDRSSRRVTVLSPQYTVVSSLTVPALLTGGLTITSAGAMVMAADSRDPERAGWPLHVLDSTFTVQRSLGTLEPRLDPSRPLDIQRVTSQAGEGRIWTAAPNEFAVELWDTLGTRWLRLERDAEWFRPWIRESGNFFETRPYPRIIAIQEDSRGYLWVLMHVADRLWRSTSASQAVVDGHVSFSTALLGTVFDTVVEVVDPRIARVVSSVRFEGAFAGFAGPRLVYEYREDERGHPYYAVLTLEVSGPEGRTP